MSAQQTVALGRAMARRLMTSSCTVFAAGEPVTDPQTGEVTHTAGVVWSGPCRVRPGGGASSLEAGGAEVFVYDYIVWLPVDAETVVARHRLTVTESTDPALAGVTMEVQKVDRGDSITRRNLYCRDVA